MPKTGDGFILLIVDDTEGDHEGEASQAARQVQVVQHAQPAHSNKGQEAHPTRSNELLRKLN